MMRALVAVIAALFVVGACGAVTFPTSIPAMNVSGLEVIFLDGPSWATQIEASWGTHEFFVFGDKTLRTIQSGRNVSSFYAEPDFDPLSYPLTDVHTFYYTDPTTSHLFKLTLGISDFNAYDSGRFSNVVGAYLPLFSAKLDLNTTATTSIQNLQYNAGNSGNANFTNFMMHAIRCDTYSQTGAVIAYFAGFYINNGGLDFVVLRTYLNMNVGLSNPTPFTFNPANDVFTLYSNQFTTFNEAYKPWIHVTEVNGHDIVIVVDPNTQYIYSVDLSSGYVSSLSLVADDTNLAIYDIVSTAFDPFSQQLVVGFANTGVQSGFFFVFNLGSAPAGNYNIPAPLERVWLPGNYSNPKALTLDNSFIYIGLNGASEILRYNITGRVFAFQRLPDFLHRAWDATVTFEHVYFVTYEQNSKVFRVDKNDFCSAACPYFGYCRAGQCQCTDGFELSKDKTQCLLTAAQKEIHYEKVYSKAHGGEVALGILFALTFIAAAGGWYMWYKGRRGAYQAV